MRPYIAAQWNCVLQADDKLAADVIVRLIATGLAAGILLDVVVVRTLLVPALVALMGK